MLTLALTGTVPEQVEPGAGEVTVTIRLPSPSIASAGDGAISPKVSPKETIADSVAVRRILTWFEIVSSED